MIGERMFDKNRGKFMSAYHRETSKPFGYLLVDNKPDTPADKQVLGDIFGSCKAYIFSTKTEKNSNEESAPISFIEARLERKQPKSHNHIIWSDAVIPVWQNYVSGAPAFRSIPEGYHIIEMYKTSRNSFDPRHPGIYVDGENYWPVKLRHHSTGGVKWIKLHENEPTVRAFVEETDKADNLISTSAQRG